MTITVTFPDGTPITNYSFDDEVLHAPGPEENWQESVAMWFYDPATECTGFMRIGHEPRMDGGNMQLWAFFRTPDWVFQHDEKFPLKPGDVEETSMGAGGISRYSFDGKGTHWLVKTDEVELDLHLTPLHQPIGLWPEIHPEYAKNIGGKHHETADRMVGSVTVRGNRIDLKGYVYRDHSWGPRNWGNLKVHRWTNGLMGEDFGWGFSNYLVAGSPINKRGFIREGSVVHYTRDVEILPLMECDAATHRGGIVRAKLVDGRIFNFELTPTGMGNMLMKRGSVCQDTLCRFKLGAREGFGILEISNNPRGGDGPFPLLVNAYQGTGLWPA